MNISDLIQSSNGSLSTICPVPDLTRVWGAGALLPENGTSLEKELDQMVRWLRLFVEPGQVVELRALRVDQGSRKIPVSGYFDDQHLEDMAKIAMSLTLRAEGVYFTLNPLKPAVLGRYNNCTEDNGQAACDKEVVKRSWLLIDVDPVRISGVSSTDNEKVQASLVVDQVREYLTGQGWSEPIFADSGNGYHLLYRIDLPVDDCEKVKKVLSVLAGKFNTEQATVDTSVFNPSRIVKLYGTFARKGSSIAERPHRQAIVLETPPNIAVVPVEKIEALASQAVIPVKNQARSASRLAFQAGAPTNVISRARAYLATVPGAVQGNKGSIPTFKVACILMKGFGLSMEEAMPLFQEWNETCQPPWSEKELIHKLEGAEKADGERGYLLQGSGAGTPNDQGVDGEELNRAIDDPGRLADLILNGQFKDDGIVTLRRWRDEWWLYKNNAYGVLALDDLEASAWKASEQEFARLKREEAQRFKGVTGGHQLKHCHKVNKALVGNVIDAIKSRTVVSSKLDQPAWLEPSNPQGANRTYLALQNGLVDLEGLLAGAQNCLSAHSPHWFSPICLPYSFDPLDKCPKWEAFLAKNLEGDQDRISLLQEWFGYCLLPDTSKQRFLVLEGEGSNGKSVVCAVLTAMLGNGNVSHVPLEAFGQRFALTQTLGKLANIAAEVGEIDKAAEGQLKSFTSGDRMMFDRKGIAAVEAMPTARLVLATNNRPRFSDRSSGLWRRMLLMPFQVEIQAHEKVYGMDKPEWWVKSGELSGIFNWAVQGLVRLRQQGTFTQTQVCQDALEDYQLECNPAKAFLLEHCSFSQLDKKMGNSTSSQTLYQNYKGWCQENNYRPLAHGVFGKVVLRVFRAQGLDKPARLGTGKDRRNCYEGLTYDGPSYSYGRF